ncbi:MAG: efflux RND transporter periplasmic adaptor subunit [Blautia sp.]|jgi:HlyD family secretion protein
MNRKKAMEMFGIFFALMLIFTVLSRAADSLTVARVQVKTPGRQVITHTVAGSGKVTGSEEEAVFMEADQKIRKMYVEEGSRVKAGDVLLEVDMDKLEEQIKSREREVSQQDLSTGDAASKLDVQGQKKSTDLARAQEDYEDTVSQENAAVANAQAEVDVAYERLNEFYQSQEGFHAEDETEPPDSSQINALLDDIRAKEQALEAAVTKRDESIKEAARKIEDAKISEGRDSSVEIGKLQQEEKDMALDKLKNLKEKGGKVYAPTDGTITKLNVHTGEVSTEGAVLLMVEEKTAFQFEAPIAEEDEKYVEKGAAVTLEGPKVLEEQKDLTVTNIVTSEDESGSKIRKLVVSLPANVGDIGDAAEYTVKKESKTYEICVPVSALRQENGKYFVYVMEERNSVLGEELAVRKNPVDVLEKNESYAALAEGGLNSQQKIIVNTDREIQDGSRVRLVEE